MPGYGLARAYRLSNFFPQYYFSIYQRGNMRHHSFDLPKPLSLGLALTDPQPFTLHHHPNPQPPRPPSTLTLALTLALIVSPTLAPTSTTS